MPTQDRNTGATANDWGQKIARQAAQLLGLPLPSGNSNEIQLTDGPCVIKSAHAKTAYVGITKTMLPRLNSALVILQSPDNDETYDIFKLNKEFLSTANITPGGKSQETQVFYKARIIREQCPRIKSFISSELDDKRNYWVTTQWPHRTDQDINSPRTGVYLPDGREAAGADLRPGDLVAVYEAKTGRSLIRKSLSGEQEVIDCHEGRQGIVALIKITSELCSSDETPSQKYTDGSEIWWRWYADAEPYSSSGFLPRVELNRALGYALGNPLKGFGDLHSGLKKITRDQFNQISAQYHAYGVSPDVEDMVKGSAKRGGHAWGRGESDIHKNLKEMVAAAPDKVLGEPGLRTQQMEFPFPTNDRADIILWDASGKIIGVEIEPAVEDDQPEGILQAIKYRFMAALMFNKRYEDSRSILIAHKISPKAQSVCRLYGVECFVIPKK